MKKTEKNKEILALEADLKESEERHRLVAKNALVGIYQLDTSGRFLFVNKAFAKMVGRKPKELIGRHFSLVLPDFKQERGKQIFKEIILADNGQKKKYAYPRVRESYLHHKKGHNLYVQYSFNFPIKSRRNSDLSKVALTGMAVDITAEKKLEEELMLQTKNLENLKTTIEHEKVQVEAILNSMGDGMVATDTYGRIIMLNKMAEKMLGWGSEELFGKPFAETIPLLDGDTELPVDNEIRPINIVLSTGRSMSTLPGGKYFLFASKEGRKFPVSITAAPVKLNKTIIGAIATFRDITKSREIDKVKGEFVSLASHQLRTPLTIISLYSEMLNNAEPALKPVQKKYLDEITAANRRMVKLVDMILNVSRIDLGVLKIISIPTDFAKIAEVIWKEFLPQIRENKINFAKEYADLPLVNSDPKLIEVVLENLISNAVRYTPAGGQITLSIQPRPLEMFIKVADTGYGIPADQQEKIFSKMFRADNILEKVTQGTGLGLYIIKSFIEKMGGKIWFESTENKGTTFYVTLPVIPISNQPKGTYHKLHASR